MKEIKYRAWYPKAKRMIHFEGIEFCAEYNQMRLTIRESDCTQQYKHLAGMSFIPNEDGIPLEYIGLKDKGGKEIYCGDVLDGEGWGLGLLVVSFGFYDNEESYEDSEQGYGWYLLSSRGEIYPITYIDLEKCYIIGNIYESPELLNG